jgi:hypothetical protein
VGPTGCFSTIELCLFGIEIEHRCCTDHFAARLLQRLSLFGGEQDSYGFDPFAQQGGGLAQYCTASLHIHRAPAFETSVCRDKRFLQIGLGRHGQFGYGLARCRVQHGKAVATFAGPPTAIDEKREIGVVILCHGNVRWFRLCVYLGIGTLL